MSLTFACECGATLRVPERYLGRQMRCFACHRMVAIRPVSDAIVSAGDQKFAAPPAPEVGHSESAPFQDRALPQPRERPAGAQVIRVLVALLLSLCVGFPLVLWAGMGMMLTTVLLPLCFGGLAATLGILGLKALTSVQARTSGKRALACGLLIGSLLCLGGALGVTALGIVAIREGARQKVAAQNLKEIGSGFHVYHDSVGYLPMGDKRTAADLFRTTGLSWRVDILPFIGEGALHQQFHLDEAWDSEHNLQLIPRMPSIYRSPRFQEQQPGATYYRALVGPLTAMGSRRPFTLGALCGVDGVSNTLLIVEAADPVIWTKPDELFYDPNGPLPAFGGPEQGDFFALFADCTVWKLSPSLGETTLRAYITAYGRERVPELEPHRRWK